MTKLLLTILLVISFSYAKQNKISQETQLREELYKLYTNELKQLKPYQLKMMKLVYKLGKRDNYAWSATAIAWQESQFGRWQINFNQKGKYNVDCGVFQNNINSVLSHNNISSNIYNKKEACTDLITDIEYAYLNFVYEMKFWEKVRKDGNFMKIWGSYNGGYRGNKLYALKIAVRIKVLSDNKVQLGLK